MSVQRGRIPVVLVLANYVLALTVGELFHVHAPPPSARTSGTGCADRPRDSAGCPADPSGGQPLCRSLCHVLQIGEREGSLPRFYHPGKCPVCQFLAQKPAPDQPIESVVCAGATCDLVVIEPVRRAVPVPRTHSIRGPPSLA